MNKPRSLPAAIVLMLHISIAWASAREWTSTDGRKLQGELISSDATQVTIKRSDNGQNVNIPLARLSAADQAFIQEQSAAPKLSAKVPTGPFASLITGDWALSEYRGLPFAIYAAKELDAAKTYPLLLMLHGKSDNNENGRQVSDSARNFTKAERYAKHPCIIVAPLCYQPHGGTGTGWRAKPGEQAIALIKELAKSLPVDRQRIYCMGVSMGGFGTCHLIASEPRIFSAGIAVSGCSPDTASTFKKVPLWLFHAADDSVVNVNLSRTLAKALEREKTCRYTEYPEGGHGIAGRAFDTAELHEWLFSQTSN